MTWCGPKSCTTNYCIISQSSLSTWTIWIVCLFLTRYKWSHFIAFRTRRWIQLDTQRASCYSPSDHQTWKCSMSLFLNIEISDCINEGKMILVHLKTSPRTPEWDARMKVNRTSTKNLIKMYSRLSVQRNHSRGPKYWKITRILHMMSLRHWRKKLSISVWKNATFLQGTRMTMQENELEFWDTVLDIRL